jgi:predicted nucleic acid-binding Zn ribbon protein
VGHEEKQDALLKSATQWQAKPYSRCCRAGEEAVLFLQRGRREYSKNAVLVEVWDELIPQGLKPHCRLDTRAGNVLTIQAAPGPYMHQIQMMQSELLAELHRQCPSVGIQKLRIIPLQDNGQE